MHICNIYSQFRSLAGGEKLAIKTCNLLVERGFTVTLLTLSINQECRNEFNKNINIIETNKDLDNIKNHYWKVLLEHIYIYKTAKLIPQESDIVCFHKSSSLLALYYYKNILKSLVPTYYFCYELPRFLYDLREETLAKLGVLGFVAKPFYPLLRFLDRKFVKSVNSILTFSDYLTNEIKQIYTKPIKMIGPLGVDSYNGKYNKEILSKYGIKENTKILLTVNRLQIRKRISLLIEAMPTILNQQPTTKLVIVGSGPEETKLKELTTKLNLDKHILFTGYVDEKNLSSFYMIADIYVHLAKNEPFGLSVIEAMAAGKTVISVKEGGPAEILNENETGFFIEPTAQAVADKVIYLLKAKNKLMEIGKKAKDYIINNYNWNSYIKRFINAITAKDNILSS
jgi:glycosyltransferase involved in cell wall biosynthesis